MSAASSVHRVAILASRNSEIAYQQTCGILDYAQHASRWRFVGIGGSPFIGLAELHEVHADGLIGELSDVTAAEQVVRMGLSVVTTSTERGDLPVAYVGNDDEATGRLGAEHVLERGFANVCFFGDSREWLTQRRLAGFRRAVEAAGRSFHQRLFRRHPGVSAREKVRGWLLELPKPIAIMTHRDFLARIAVNAAGALGMRVPDDVAVLGVHNNRMATLLAATPVSSIQPDWHRIGYLAAEALDGMMRGGVMPKQRWVAPVGVVARRSTDITLVEDEVVTAALAYIRDHCCVEGIGVEDVLDHVAVSRRNLEIRMKSAVGLTPQAAITRGRVEQAKRLLLETDKSMEAIAWACGFSQRPRLNEAFKRVTGMTPGAFRRRRG